MDQVCSKVWNSGKRCCVFQHVYDSSFLVEIVHCVMCLLVLVILIRHVYVNFCI